MRIVVNKELSILKFTTRLWSLLSAFVLLGLAFASAQAQTAYLYSNNNPSGPNSVGRFRIEADGSLTSLGATPTGGDSSFFGFYGSQRIAVTGNFLYATNATSQSLSGFTINPANGDLTSAFPPIVFGGAAPVGFSVRATPNGQFLYVQLDSTIEIFSINQTNGQLTSAGSFNPGINIQLNGMAISRNGALLALSSPVSGQVAVLQINPTTGALTQASGSPFTPSGASSLAGVEFNAAGDRLFVGAFGSNRLNVIQVDATTGAVSGDIAGSPFANSGLASQQAIIVSADGQRLYTRDSQGGSIAAFTIDANGTPTPIAGSPVAVPGEGNMILHPAGTFIYSSNRTAGAINSNAITGGLVGATAPNSPYTTGVGGGVTWFATYGAVNSGPVNVNSQVTFTVTTQGLTGITGACSTLGYTNQYNINADLRNVGTNTFTSPFFQVVALQQTDGPAPANPFRLRTADDFNASLCTGGLVGTTQGIPGPVVPSQVVPVNFQIAMPALRRFQFLVSVFATITSPPMRAEPVNRKGRTQVSRIGNLKVEVTGFDKAGNPLLTATFIPEKGMEGQFQVAGVRATMAK